jgi:predicted RNA-binding protein with PUA-like domain
MWLFKEEPRHYSFDRLERDGTTRWTGVRNPLAQRHLRAVRKGDSILYYHSGSEKAIVGVARAVTDAYPDPGDSTGRPVAVDIAPDRRLARPVPLSTLKASKAFASSPVVRIPRLSVMPVTPARWRAVEAVARG